MSCVLTPYFRCSAEMLLTPPLFPHLSFLTESSISSISISSSQIWSLFILDKIWSSVILLTNSSTRVYLSFVYPPCIGSWKMSRLELTCLCLAMIGRAPQRMWRTTMWWWSPDCHSSSLRNTVKRMWCNSWWGVEFALYQVFSPQCSFACNSTEATITGVRRPRYRGLQQGVFEVWLDLNSMFWERQGETTVCTSSQSQTSNQFMRVMDVRILSTCSKKWFTSSVLSVWSFWQGVSEELYG